MNLGLIYNIVLKGLIGNDINSISNELRISIYEFKTIIGTIRLKSLLQILLVLELLIMNLGELEVLLYKEYLSIVK